MTVNKLIRDLDKAMQRIANERDRLDDILGEAETLLENCRHAHDALQEARDALSELV
jgi:ABC-type transporter Mla subunit MlaD